VGQAGEESALSLVGAGYGWFGQPHVAEDAPSRFRRLQTRLDEAGNKRCGGCFEEGI
jgi:hypothetical protein